MALDARGLALPLPLCSCLLHQDVTKPTILYKTDLLAYKMLDHLDSEGPPVLALDGDQTLATDCVQLTYTIFE